MKKPILKWDLYNGEGDVGNLESFRDCDPLLRCDILGDWVGILQAEYERAQREFLDHLNKLKNAHQP